MNEPFSKVGVYQYSSEALIFKGRLDAEGVETMLVDETTINTDPLVSNAIGGVKLFVRSEDKERALAILESVDKYSLDDEGKEINCPNCDSTKIDFFTNVKDFKSLISFLFGFIFGALPFYTKYEYRCEDCKTKFSLK